MAKAKELQELGQWKVGQAVLLTMGGANNTESVVPITQITDGRGGTIYVGDYLFDANGHQRTSNEWTRAYIQPAVEADITRIKGKNARYRISKVDWRSLDPVKAIEIEKLLNANGIETRTKI